MGTLRGRRALVTGGSRGIGAGIATALAKSGADVAITYRREKRHACELEQKLRAYGIRAVSIRCDVTDLADVEAAFKQADFELGGIDTVVANAGIASGRETIAELEPRYWHKVIDTNLTGAFFTLRTSIPYLRRSTGASITTISSIAADLCGEGGGAYNAAKAALNAITMTAAREEAPNGIRINAIAPGLIDTEMGRMMLSVHGNKLLEGIPLGRLGTADEIGELVCYLAGDSAGWITGKILRIDGGVCIKP
jgi:3-oxoacyl-[acyl-carrier protein] reductase